MGIKSFFLCGVLLCASLSSEEELPSSEIVNEAIASFGAKMIRHDRSFIGFGGGIDPLTGKKKVLSAVFSIKYVTGFEEARREYLQLFDRFMDTINRDETLRSHLADTPITAQNIDLTLIISHAGAGNVCRVFNRGEEIVYLSNPKNPKLTNVQDQFVERVNEARGAL